MIISIKQRQTLLVDNLGFQEPSTIQMLVLVPAVFPGECIDWLIPCTIIIIRDKVISFVCLSSQKSAISRYMRYYNCQISRALHLHAASASMQEQHWSTCMFVDDLNLRLLGHLCAWAESTWPAVAQSVGVANINALFVTLMGCTKGIEAYWSQFFANFNRFVVLTSHSDAQISRCGDFHGDNDKRQTKPIALPLASNCQKRQKSESSWLLSTSQGPWKRQIVLLDQPRLLTTPSNAMCCLHCTCLSSM